VIAPDGDLDGRCASRSPQRQGQPGQVRRREFKVIVVQCRADQRQPRRFALRQETAVARHHHPFAIVLQPARRQPCLRQRNAATGLDGINEERGDRDHAR